MASSARFRHAACTLPILADMPQTPSIASSRSHTRLALTAGAGLLGAVALPWLLVLIANLLPSKSAIAMMDDRVGNWQIEHGTPAADAAFRIISAFGGWLLVAVVLGAFARFAMRRQYYKNGALLAACAGGALVNIALALTFRRAQPISATEFVSVAQGVSFPSGHSMLALIAYGMLTYFVLQSPRSSEAKRIASVAAAALLIVLIGVARIYLGVHSVSDVVLGFAAGGVWLAACIAAYRQLTPPPRASAAPDVPGLVIGTSET
jgi:membrane-associated phospholipid phosphatase